MTRLKPDKYKVNLYFDTAVCVIGIALLLVYLFLITLVVSDKVGVYSASWFIPATGLFLVLKLILLLLQFYVLLGLTVALLQVVILSFMYCFYVFLFYTVELELGKIPGNYKSDENLRNNQTNLRNVYRGFQVLNAHAMYIIGPFVLVSNAVFMAEIQYFTFILIRYWPTLELFAKLPLMGGCIIMPIIWTAVMEFGRLFYSQGTKVITSWKKGKWDSPLDNKIMSRFRKSCKPLLIAYGSTFIVKRSSLLTFYKGVFRGIFRALLTTKKN